MNISKATLLDKKTRRGIARRAWRGNFWLIPTNGPECYIACNRTGKPVPRWEPDADDITARDWYVIGLNSFHEKAYSYFHAVLETVLHPSYSYVR